MSPTPVRRLTIADPALPDSFTVPIGWDILPASLQERLEALDTNDDGEILYAPAGEVRHADGTAAELNRILWAASWPNPFNNRTVDRATLPDRLRTAGDLQNAVYDRIVLPILGDRGNLDRWRHAGRILVETADFVHLTYLAQIAKSEWERSGNLEYLSIAEDFLLNARRFAARVSWGQTAFLPLVEREIEAVNRILDRADEDAFREDLKFPYLMATFGSPITADFSEIRSGGLIDFGVAVPPEFAQTHRDDLAREILRFFEESPVRIRGSLLRDEPGARDFPLAAVRVERDAPEPEDDRIDRHSSSFHINHDRMNRTVFGGRSMLYFRVGFRLDHAAEALAGRPLRKFDVSLKRGARTRTVLGGLVLQDLAGRTTRSVFASDLHVSERDYEIAAVMKASLEGTELADRREEIDRFYESINEQVEAAVDLWNEAYRNGEIDRVFLAGDIADFANAARTLERVGFRSTNVRRVKAILSRFEGPLYVVTGNHDHHGSPYPFSLSPRNFLDAPHLRDLTKDHYDRHRFPPDGPLHWEGIKALLPSACGDGSCLTHVIREISAPDPFGPINDDFLDHHLREVGIYETLGTSLGNGFRVFAWPTETEHFNYNRFLAEEAREPVGESIFRAMRKFLIDQEPSGRGPRPEVFVSFLRELEAARLNGQRVLLTGHYPPFHRGEGDREAAGRLRDDAAWAVRLASWYYRTAEGEPVLAAAVSGHVHHYGEVDFRFRFADSTEEGRFRAELGEILARKNASSGSGGSGIFEDLHELRHAWDLDNRMEIRSVWDAGSDGYPGPIVRSPQRDRTLFLNLPALGIPSEDQSGYLILTTGPDGEIEAAPRLLRVGPEGTIITAGGGGLEDFRRGRREAAGSWDPSRESPPFEVRRSPTEVKTFEPGTRETPRWDLFPLVYQYPKRKIGLTLDLGVTSDFRRRGFGFLAGGQLLFPLSDHVSGTFGGPNYLALRAEYSTLKRGLNTGIGIDFGAVMPYLILNAVTSGNPLLGGEVVFHGLLPLLPSIGLWGGSTVGGDWGIGLNVRLTVPALTYRLGKPH